MTKEDEQMKQIEEILLKHVGTKNAISARKIAKKVGINDNDTFVHTRMLIRKLMKNRQLPIGATTERGYFIIRNKKELTNYAKLLDKRIHGISTRKFRAIVYFENYYKKEFKKEDLDEEFEETI